MNTHAAIVHTFIGSLLFLMMLLAPGKCWGQTTGDYRTGQATVTWATAANWQTWNGTAWITASNAPTSSTDVYIQAGHVATLGADASCKNLFISTGTTSPTTGGDGQVALAGNVLSISGKLSSYVGGVSITLNSDALSITPSATIPAAPITKTANSATGRIKIVGDSRTLTPSGEWAASNTASVTTFDIEISLNSNQTATLVSAIKAYNWILTSGILDAGSTRIYADNGTTGQGDVTINSGATLISAQTGTVNQVICRTASSAMGTLL